MKSNLLFDFSVNKNEHKIFVKRAFNADQQLVWDAFTNSEILDEWWAPQPWKSKTKYMNFIVGGRRFYAMVSPQNDAHWSIQDFTSITPISNFQFVDAFADQDENIQANMPSATWNLNFTEVDAITTVDITIQHQSLENLETIIQMGFKEGFSATLDYLDNYIQTQFLLRKQK